MPQRTTRGMLLEVRALLVSSALLCGPALAQELLYTSQGTAPEQRFGYALLVVPDVDGDGASDLVVGAPGEPGGGTPGLVQLLSGRDGQPLARRQGLAGGDSFGRALAPLDDLDGDGVDELLVAAPQRVLDEANGFLYGPATGPGYAQVLSGKTLVALRTHTGATFGGAFGFSVAGGKDLDGDGVGDYAVGEPRSELVHVLSGASGQLLYTLQPTDPKGDLYGMACLLLDDIDGDGLAEVVVGRPTFEVYSFQNPTEVTCYSGATGSVVWKSLETDPSLSSQFGYKLWSAGDMTGDGKEDLVVHSKEYGNCICQLGQGRLTWISGVDGSHLGEILGQQSEEGLGHGLALLGDLDGNGRTEAAVGTPSNQPDYPPLSSKVNDIRIFDGTPGSQIGLVSKQGQPLQSFGYALASGDLDGDGLRELIVGSPFADEGAGTSSGRLAVFTWLLNPQRYCTTQVNSLGCAPSLSFSGSTSLAGAGLSILASNLRPQSIGLLFFGSAPASQPFKGGTLCVQPPSKRTPAQSSGGSGSGCDGTLSFTFTPAYLLQNGLGAGTAAYSQAWSRDAAMPLGTNLTDAVAFTVTP